MSNNVRPPDDWNDDQTDEPDRSRQPAAAPRPLLSTTAEGVRTAWINSVRAFLTAQNGKPSKYNSNVQWDGGRQVVATKKGYRDVRPVWPAIADRAKQAGIAKPTDLTKALFSRWQSDTLPTPWNLIDEKVLVLARELPASTAREVGLARRAEEAVFRMAVWAQEQILVDPLAAAAYVLNDVGRELSPLFRYSVACIRNLPTVAARWRHAAEHQLLQSPDLYLTHWSGLIPTDLEKAARTAVRTD